jgi:futalosine hydrolase
MGKRLLIVAATEAEAAPLKGIVETLPFMEGYRSGNWELSFLVTGVGSVATSWSLSKWISDNRLPDLMINAGIAGSYRSEIPVGEVVVPVSDCFADAGIETGGEFKTLFEAGLEDPDDFPFINGRINADNKYINNALHNLRTVNAITVNTASGTTQTIDRLRKKYDPDIETMESATFFYICSRGKIPFLALRSISNMVEPRDRSKWDIPLALRSLSEKLKEVVLTI